MCAWLQRVRRVSTALREDRCVRKVTWRAAERGHSPCTQSSPLHEGPVWWRSQSIYQTTKRGDLHSSSLAFRHEVWITLLKKYLFILSLGFPGGSDGKESSCNAGDLGSIPGLGRSSRGGHGNPLQYSCLENPMARGAWWATVHGVTKSRTWLNNFPFTLMWKLGGVGFAFL